MISTALFKVLHLNEYFHFQVRLVKFLKNTAIQRELGYGGQASLQKVSYMKVHVQIFRKLFALE